MIRIFFKRWVPVSALGHKVGVKIMRIAKDNPESHIVTDLVREHLVREHLFCASDQICFDFS